MDEPLPPLPVPADRRGDDTAVAVVGGGAVGVTVAYDLARRGADVTLYERDAIGGGATYRSAGICHDAFADPVDAAVAGESVDRLRNLADEDTFSFVECPYVWLARTGDERSAEAIRSGVRQMQSQGVVALEADGDALAERVPDLETDDVAVAGIAGAAGHVDPVRYTACLAAAASGAGAEVVTETAATIETAPLRVVAGETTTVDAVVVAAGSASGAVLEPLGSSLPIEAYATQALLAGGPTADAMWHDLTAGCYARPHPEGVVAGGTPRPVDGDGDPRVDDAVSERVCDRLEERVGGVGPLEREWAGRCTATPDGRPLAGAVAEGIYVATGFAGLGTTFGPALGERLADQVLGGPGIDDYDPTRFDGAADVALEGLGPPANVL